jgi:hypothetical protein
MEIPIMPINKPSAADATAAHAAQADAAHADAQAYHLADLAEAAEAAEAAALDTYTAAIVSAQAARRTADTARADAARVIAIYANGVSAKS